MSYLKLPEQIYYSAPFETEAQRAFNRRIIRLVRTYNFPTFFPQEKREEGMSDEEFHAFCLEALNQSHLVLAVAYGDVFTEQTAFDIGYAQGRRHQVVCLRNNLDQQPVDTSGTHRDTLLWKCCVRFIDTHARDEDMLNPLVSVLNRYYGSYSTSLLS